MNQKPVVQHCLAIATCLVAFISVPTFAQSESPEERVTAKALEHRLKLEFDGSVFSGPAWDKLLSEGKSAQFFLLGEEHGIAENPMLAAQLFSALAEEGYEKLVIEISAPIAKYLDQALNIDGLAGLQALYAQPGGEPAFFGMFEESAMLAAVRSSLPDSDEVLWGVDYEVASDRILLGMVQDVDHPASAEQPLNTLVAAADQAWAQYAETGNITLAFTFSGDPALVRNVIDAWPDPGSEASLILQTLESTLQINRLWVERRGYDSNAMRAAFLRSNFLYHWNAEKAQGNSPKLMAKLGASHIVRGLNSNGTFDLGTLLPEIAAMEGGHSFSVLVLPGVDSKVAVLDPTSWTYAPQAAKDGYAEGIGPITAAAYPDTFTLIDLAPLRSIVGTRSQTFDEEMIRVVQGFDMVLVMSGSTASGELDHD